MQWPRVRRPMRAVAYPPKRNPPWAGRAPSKVAIEKMAARACCVSVRSTSGLKVPWSIGTAMQARGVLRRRSSIGRWSAGAQPYANFGSGLSMWRIRGCCGVDRQHGVALVRLGPGAIDPGVPQSRQTPGLAVGAAKAPPHVALRLPARLVERLRRHDAALAPRPGLPCSATRRCVGCGCCAAGAPAVQTTESAPTGTPPTRARRPHPRVDLLHVPPQLPSTTLCDFRQAVPRDHLNVADVLGMHAVLLQRCGGALGAVPTIDACLYSLMRPRPPICPCWPA